MTGQNKRIFVSAVMATLFAGCTDDAPEAAVKTPIPAATESSAGASGAGPSTGGTSGAAVAPSDGAAIPEPAPVVEPGSTTPSLGNAAGSGPGSSPSSTGSPDPVSPPVSGPDTGAAGSSPGTETPSQGGAGGNSDVGAAPTPPPPDPNDNVTNPEPDEVIGFGAGTTGGAGGPEVTVSTIDELIAAAASEGPLVINVKGNLVHSAAGSGGDNDRVWVASNKTIQGADSSASVEANFTNARENDSCSNIIIRNIKLLNPEGKGTGDAVEFTNGVSKIWIDHVTFGQSADGSLDFKRGADLATVSWCKFDYADPEANHNYTNLVGHSDKYPNLDRGKLRVTFHHNWYTAHSHQRMPRVRYGQVHIFNNYYAPALRPPEKTGTGPDYLIGVGVEAQILLEASYFENPNGHPWTNETAWFNWYPANKCDEPCAEGKIRWTDDNLFTKGTMPSTWAQNSDVFDPPYKYRHVLQSAENAKASVMERAGVLK